MAAGPPAAEHLPDSDAALAAFATDVTRALLAEITPAERAAGKKNELQRLDAVVLAAMEKESEHLGASRVRNVEATARGAATKQQQTLDDGAVTEVLARSVKEAKAERAALKKTIPGQPHFLAAAMDAVSRHISEEEELELTPQQRAVVHQAVMLEVNTNVSKPAG